MNAIPELNRQQNIAGQGVVLTWIRTVPDLAQFESDWFALVDRVGADVFMRPDWQAVWWLHFGANRELVCVVARYAGRVVGVVPFSVERISLGLGAQKIARLAGTDPNSIIFQLALEDEFADAVLQAAIEHLTFTLGCLAVSFTPVSDLAVHLPDLRVASCRNKALAIVERAAGSHTIFEFTPRFEDYLAGLTKKRRGQLRRDEKGLQDRFDMTSAHFAPDATAFDDFVEFHLQTWRGLGKGGHFSDWPGSAAFIRDLAVRTAPAKLVQIDELRGRGGALAAEFSLVAGVTAHWRLPARRRDPDLQRYGAGKVVFLRMFERMVRQGIRRIEGGRGDYPYKLEFGGKRVPVHALIISRANSSARMRLRLLFLWSDLLNLIYYRIWFLKIAPRVYGLINAQPRPLWRSWIRSRL